MCKHEEKICPGCANTFECKVGDISHCGCNTILLSTRERDFIEKKYDDCLCVQCLLALKKSNTEENMDLKNLSFDGS